MLTKTRLKRTLKEFPEDFSLEELMDKLILLDKVEKAGKQSEQDETISEIELEKEMEKWFK